MASPESAISQVFAPATNYWENPSNWAKPVQGNQFTAGTQALNSMGSINSENPAGTGFSAAGQGVTGGEFGATSPQGSIPNTPTGQQATNNAPQNASVGNNQAQIQASGNDVINTNQSLLNPQSSNNQQQAVQGSSDSGSGLLSTIGSLGSNLGSSLGLSGEGSLGSQIGQGLGLTGPSGIGAQIDAWGAGNLGTGVTGVSGSVAPNAAMTPEEFANAGAGASLTGIFSGAGIGAGIGSIYGSLTGKTGANATNADIGGALGGAGGAAFGAELGSMLFPGAGTMLGAVAGSVLGGLFGPSAGTNYSAENSNIMAGGGLDMGVGGGKNPNSATGGFVNQTTNAFSQLTKAASEQLGIQFNPKLVFESSDNTLHGGKQFNLALETGPNATPNGPGVAAETAPGTKGWETVDASNISKSYFDMLSGAAQNSGYTDTQALYNWFYGQPSQGANPIEMSNSISIAPQGGSNTGLNPIG